MSHCIRGSSLSTEQISYVDAVTFAKNIQQKLKHAN